MNFRASLILDSICITFLVLLPLWATAQENPEESPPTLELPASCAGIDPAKDATEVLVDGERRLALRPLAASCLLARLDLLEKEASLRADYWRSLLAIRAEAARERLDACKQEADNREAVVLEAVADAQDGAAFWKWGAVIGAVAGVVAGGAAVYYFAR